MPLKEDGSRNIDTDWDQAKTWAQMEAVLASGKVKAIGVSNFSAMLLDDLSKSWKTVPAVNQVSHYSPFHSTSQHRQQPIVSVAACQEIELRPEIGTRS